ncbi:MAG: hypothetical protein FJ137_16315 [Deltaproteobacteria bacterium]|nr:hypothetical protein [Deltaproteobacteria bacterium]
MLGFDVLREDDRFVWGDGRSWTFQVTDVVTRWAGGEPNNAGGAENCAHVWSFTLEWNDIRCDVGMASVCGLMPPVLPADPPPDPPPLLRVRRRPCSDTRRDDDLRGTPHDDDGAAR